MSEDNIYVDKESECADSEDKRHSSEFYEWEDGECYYCGARQRCKS